MRRFGVQLIGVVVVGLLAGCGGGQVKSPLGQRAVVKGKVTVAGKPLARGTVVFSPVDPAKGDEQIGPISNTGEYITSVFAGRYKVSVKDNPAVPAKFQSPQSSDQEVDVPAAGKEGADVDLR